MRPGVPDFCIGFATFVLRWVIDAIAARIRLRRYDELNGGHKRNVIGRVDQ